VQNGQWPAISVIGAGAVGCYFGGMLARAGAPVTLIGRLPHVEAIRTHGLYLDSSRFQQYIAVSASTSIEAARNAAIVLFCVKTVDTEEAAKMLAPHLGSRSIVVSLQNGVDNVERIRSVISAEVVPAVVYVAAEMIAPGHVKHTGRGDLIIGHLPRREFDDHAGDQRQLAFLADLFARAEIPCRISDDIQVDLWSKLIMNCAYNAISALTRARYGRLAHEPGTREVIARVVDEAVAVARRLGIQISANMLDAVWKLGVDMMPGAISSTAQDIGRGKRTEIDALNGHVVRRGADLGIPTPVNQALHALVKVLEDSPAL
jgi:2-dehydropantoate 2-reductase